jgi:hypothetical protein
MMQSWLWISALERPAEAGGQNGTGERRAGLHKPFQNIRPLGSTIDGLILCLETDIKDMRS